jgi:hypothetical protein
LRRNWRKALVGGGGVLALAGMVIWAAAAQTATGAGTATIAIAPASMNQPANGGSFTVDVNAENVDNLGAFEFVVAFDEDLLTYEGIAGSGWLGSTGRHQQCFEPSAGANGESAVQMANTYGAVHYGCSSNGLISGGEGIAGPGGSATLATLQFKPKAAGTADLEFAGVATAYVLWNQNGSQESGQTGMAEVEVCDGASGQCAESGVDVNVQNGVVNVFDPNAPTPTGVPATPTQKPKDPTPDTRATVEAALGTPVVHGTPVPGSAQGGSGDPPIGTSAGGVGTRGNSSGGSVAGNSSGGATGGARGANGAPVAGYGPQEQHDPLPQRTAVGLTMVGFGLAGVGLLLRRRAATER